MYRKLYIHEWRSSTAGEKGRPKAAGKFWETLLAQLANLALQFLQTVLWAEGSAVRDRRYRP
jgi:hypothetical protein